MNLLHGVGDFFSLDIGTNSMRIIQLSGNIQHGWVLQKFAYVPIDQKLTMDSSDLGKKRLGEAVMGAVNQAGIKTKNVALGLPATKTFTSVVETETLPEKELAKSFKYELDKYVPMSLSDAKADYIILGPSPNDPAKTEILVSSIAKDYAESTMEMIEKTGLNIVAMEPEPLAMARSLNIPGAMDATMVVDFGEKSTDIAINYKDQPRLVRSIPGGIGVLVKASLTVLAFAKIKPVNLSSNLVSIKTKSKVKSSKSSTLILIISLPSLPNPSVSSRPNISVAKLAASFSLVMLA